jgi:hypothetical protein
MRTIPDVINRLRAEFLEMPCLRLTSAQVQRLCGVEHTICRMVLDVLVKEGFLYVTSEGHYARPATGPVRVKANSVDAQIQNAS